MNNIQRFRAMQGSLKVRNKPRLKWEKPKKPKNDPSFQTLHDKIMKIKHKLGYF